MSFSLQKNVQYEYFLPLFQIALEHCIGDKGSVDSLDGTTVGGKKKKKKRRHRLVLFLNLYSFTFAVICINAQTCLKDPTFLSWQQIYILCKLPKYKNVVWLLAVEGIMQKKHDSNNIKIIRVTAVGTIIQTVEVNMLVRCDIDELTEVISMSWPRWYTPLSSYYDIVYSEKICFCAFHDVIISSGQMLC